MKKILFLVNAGEISSNTNGGASVYYSHLELLFKAGFSIDILVLEWEKQHKFDKKDYGQITSFVKSINTYKVMNSTFRKGVFRLIDAIFNPSKFEYSFLNKENFSALNRILQHKDIDFVWCEWRWSALLATNAQLKTPVIYAHHDWEYKLAKLRTKQSLLQMFHAFQKKKVEMKLVKNAVACISGSYTEVKEIAKITSKKTLYLPTTYGLITSSKTRKETPSIVHLGGMGTTANRIGLERFLEMCWSEIKRALPTIELKVIGSLKQAPTSLLDKLKDKQIECLGFVKDLSTVLKPEDIHIIPWEHNTGTRTRIPVIFNYKQVLVATKESVSCYPEITKENSVLCDDLHQMTAEIVNLYSDRERLHLLSTKGKEVFLNTFTIESQVENLKTFIHNLR